MQSLSSTCLHAVATASTDGGATPKDHSSTDAVITFYPPIPMSSAQPLRGFLPRNCTVTDRCIFSRSMLLCSVNSLQVFGLGSSQHTFPLGQIMAKQQVHLPPAITELNLEPGLPLCIYLSRATAPSPAVGLALRDLPTSSEPQEITTWELRQGDLEANKS